MSEEEKVPEGTAGEGEPTPPSSDEANVADGAGTEAAAAPTEPAGGESAEANV